MPRFWGATSTKIQRESVVYLSSGKFWNYMTTFDICTWWVWGCACWHPSVTTTVISICVYCSVSLCCENEKWAFIDPASSWLPDGYWQEQFVVCLWPIWIPTLMVTVCWIKAGQGPNRLIPSKRQKNVTAQECEWSNSFKEGGNAGFSIMHLDCKLILRASVLKQIKMSWFMPAVPVTSSGGHISLSVHSCVIWSRTGVRYWLH